MLVISVKTNVERFQAKVDDVAKRQLPFAAATALTSLAGLVAAAEKANEPKKLDRPRPFTTEAIGSTKARKDDLLARVYMKDLTAEYMLPYEFGGLNKLNSKALLKPVDAKKDLDAFGNIPAGYLAKFIGSSWTRKVLAGMKSGPRGGRAMARPDVFIGPVKMKSGKIINGIWQRSTDAGVKRVGTLSIDKKTGKARIVKSAKNINRSGKLKLIVRFTDAHPIAEKNRLDWFDLAQKTVSSQFLREFTKSMRVALATAK